MQSIRPAAICPARNAVGLAALAHEIAIKRIVARFDKQILQPVAALRDMKKRVGNHDAGAAGHAVGLHERGNYAIGMASP